MITNCFKLIINIFQEKEISFLIRKMLIFDIIR